MGVEAARWIVVGAAGMLGSDLVSRLAKQGHMVRGLDRPALDITDAAACVRELSHADVIVNCAAWTAVDAAEEHEGEAFGINATGAANLARAASATGARLVQVSTDYVFRGDAKRPYPEDAPLDPVSAYGRTKAAGEWAVRAQHGRNIVVRTAWLYGAGGSCFPRTIARVAAERGSVDVVDDQHGQPTWSRDVADLIIRLISAEVPGGIYHGTSTGSASWHEFAREVVSAAGLDPLCVDSTSSAAFTRPAPRPSYSVLGHGALASQGVEPIGAWRERWQVAAAQVLAGR